MCLSSRKIRFRVVHVAQISHFIVLLPYRSMVDLIVWVLSDTQGGKSHVLCYTERQQSDAFSESQKASLLLREGEGGNTNAYGKNAEPLEDAPAAMIVEGERSPPS